MTTAVIKQVSQERRRVTPGRGDKGFLVLMPWERESVIGQWRLVNSFQQENPRAKCLRKGEAHYRTPKHFLVSTLIVFGVFCHSSILTFVKGSAGTDHGLGEKPHTLGSFCWELLSVEWSQGTSREAMRHHKPPLSATQLTVDLRFQESVLHMYKSSCCWSSGTKCHDHRESFILKRVGGQLSCYHGAAMPWVFSWFPAT